MVSRGKEVLYLKDILQKACQGELIEQEKIFYICLKIETKLLIPVMKIWQMKFAKG